MRAGRPSPRSLLRWLAAVAALATGAAACAQPPAPAPVEALEAAYLHKLPGFVEWPAGTFDSGAAPIVIGIAGAPAIFDELARIAKGRLVQGRPVEPRFVAASARLPRDLQVLFIGTAAAAEAAALVDDARAGHVLVVTDAPEAMRAGAAIGFVVVDGRVRFVAAPGEARRAGLKLGSQLLGVAWKVQEDKP
jgi:hypothetical protein